MIAPVLNTVGVVGSDRHLYAIAIAPRYPPKSLSGKVRPAEGYSVAPSRPNASPAGVELLFSITAGAEGRYLWRGVRVSYKQGGEFFTVTDTDTFALCVDNPAPERCRTS